MTVTAWGRWGLALLVLALSATAARLDAAEPEIRNLNVRGLQIGATTTLVIDGDDLGSTARLLLPFAAKQERKPGPAGKQATFDVTLAADVQPGYSNLSVVTESGVSLPLVIAVDRLPQRPLGTPIAELPVALHGAAAGSVAVETKFPGKAGQKILVEVEAQRLGSKLRPVAHLYSPKRLQVGWSWPTPALAGDTRLEVVLPEDGEYTVAIHDAEYAPPGPSFFRLRIGQWAFVDQVFPPVVGAGKQTVELIGPSAPAHVELTTTSGATTMPLDWPAGGVWSGPRPFVRVSSRPEVVKQPAAAKGQDLPAGPVGVSGRLLTPFEEDRYRIPVRPGTKVRFEVFAERLGSPLDAALVVRNESGAELARVEDSPGTLDPVLEYAVPEPMTSLLVGVVDAQGRGGPRCVYRLIVDPQSPAGGERDFHLLTSTQRVTLPPGGRTVVPVLIERRGYRGGITLSADGLLAGVTLEGTTIPPEAEGTLVTVQRGAASVAAITHWRGRSDDGKERSVNLKGHPLERLQPWLATELAVAPAATSAADGPLRDLTASTAGLLGSPLGHASLLATTALVPGRAADFQVDWRSLPADAGLIPAGKLVLPVKLSRPATNALVRLTPLTSQLPPLVNNQPDLNAMLRLEKPVELAANVAEGELTLLVPPQLTAPIYDVTVQAELLAPDRKTVLAVAHAPVRRMAVRPLVVVQLEGPARLEAKADPKMGTAFKIKGKVERREGLAGDVVVSLAGLPAGGRADAVTVKAAAADFALDVILPPTVPAGELTRLKLSGTAAPDAKQPNVRVRSRDVELTLVVQSPTK